MILFSSALWLFGARSKFFSVVKILIFEKCDGSMEKFVEVTNFRRGCKKFGNIREGRGVEGQELAIGERYDGHNSQFRNNFTNQFYSIQLLISTLKIRGISILFFKRWQSVLFPNIWSFKTTRSTRTKPNCYLKQRKKTGKIIIWSTAVPETSVQQQKMVFGQ